MKNVVFLALVTLAVCALVLFRAADPGTARQMAPRGSILRSVSGEADREPYLKSLERRLSRWQVKVNEYATRKPRDESAQDVTQRVARVADWNRRLHELQVNLTKLREETGETWARLRVDTEARASALRDSLTTFAAE